MTKQARAEVTREAILQGSAEIFDRYGYGSATLSDVIARSGVTKGALYFHFSSKEDLARALVERYQSQLRAPSQEALERSGHALESVIRLSYTFADQLVNDVVVRAGVRLTLEQGVFGPMSSDSYRWWTQVVEDLVTRSAAEGDIRLPVEPPALARFLVASFTGVQIFSQVFAGRADLMGRVRDMWEVVLPALVPARKLPFYRQVADQYVTG